MAAVVYAGVALSLVQISAQVTGRDWRLSVAAAPPGPLLEGDDVTLTCLIFASGDHAPSGWVQWQRGRDRADPTPAPLTEPVLAVSGDNLTLAGASRNQTGWYRCAGTSVWATTYWNPNTFADWTAVEVLYPPEITNKDRTWIGADDSRTAALQCTVRSNPPPAVAWYGPSGAPITGDTEPGRISLEETITGEGVAGYVTASRLVIAAVANDTDYGMYRCTAANNISATYDEHEIQLKETGKPETPRGLRVYYLTETDISVAWELGYDGGQELTAHYVNVRRVPGDFDPGGWVERCPAAVKTGHFSYLRAGTLYQAAVYAANVHGDSPYATVDQRTRPDTPDYLGIRVTYNRALGRLTVVGMPRGGGDGGACLRLVGYDDDRAEWASLRPDLDCVRRDGELEYAGPLGGHIHCRYCHGGLCSAGSHVSEVFPTTDRPPLPNWPDHDGDAVDIVGVAAGVTAGTFLLALVLGVWYYKKGLKGCVKPSSSSAQLTRHAAPVYPTAEMHDHASDAPPSYNEALEMGVSAGSQENPPPPPYASLSSVTTAPRESAV